MATGRPQSSTAKKRELLTCAICIGIYKSPRLLPCHHSFCEQCLVDLSMQHPSGTFPCPSCRGQTTVPSGGVSAFQANFHIDPEDLARAIDGTHCTVHTDNKLDLFCVLCDVAMCVNCKLTEHELHETKDLTKAAELAKLQLTEDKDRLKAHSTNMSKTTEFIQNEWQAVMDKKSVLEKAIHNRHATLQAAIDRYRDEALASLTTVTNDILAVKEVEMVSQQENLQELTKLQQRVQQALDRGVGSELVTVAREMRCGRGSEEAVQKLTTKQMTTVCCPVLRFSATPDSTLQHMRDYMGSAAKMEMAVSAPEVTVVEQFRCREDPDTDVYHVCPMTDDNVWVSYEPYMLRNHAAAEKFSTDGVRVQSFKCEVAGKIAWARIKDGHRLRQQPKTKGMYTYAKKCQQDLIFFFILFNGLGGQATVKIHKILSEDPLKVEATNIFTLHCAAHRAFDVDVSEQLFVVLEEGKTPDWQRRVQMYGRSQPDSIATYSPPVAPFQPSDVCFYTLGGQEVLLVADELNDAIHVVNVQDGRLSFARYLSPGCPLLVQPTALNTDTRGRLWVACRGGSILTCTPTT